MRNTLICTVGTSLLRPNLFGLPNASNYENWLKRQPSDDRQFLSSDVVQELTSALEKKDELLIAERLKQLPGNTRLCGAEINSITDLVDRHYCQENSTLIFCHSDTEDGRLVAEILKCYYELKDYPVQLFSISDLQDADPKRFRTKGLRNLTKIVCRVISERGASYCAINATGGYKAQIAIGVLMGQALAVPVYYKHEFFSEIIPFPPMPISLDHSLWMRYSGVLLALERANELPEATLDADNWDERLETLVERVVIDDATYLSLSPTGQIFYETFLGRFQSDRDQILPPEVLASKKTKPKLSKHNWGNARDRILNFMQRLIDECPYVQGCYTHYWDPVLACATLFRLTGRDIEGVFSNGSWTVKIIVETSATTSGQREACVADLNQQIGSWNF